MNPDLNKKWEQAAASGLPIPVGDSVVCDVCNEDYTNSPLEGGFIFGSYAYCRKCVERHMPEIIRLGEMKFIQAVAFPGERFADFVRRYRGPDAAISVTNLDPPMS
jgi:hypothetical protein